MSLADVLIHSVDDAFDNDPLRIGRRGKPTDLGAAMTRRACSWLRLSAPRRVDPPGVQRLDIGGTRSAVTRVRARA